MLEEARRAKGRSWCRFEQSVHGFRKHRDIAPYRQSEWAERGEITLEAAAITVIA
jgi:hypothetical protein